MPALVAMRFNPDLKAKYTALRAAGKPAKVATVAFVGENSAPRCFLALLIAQAPENRQPARQARPPLDRKSPLIKTDTHSRRAGVPRYARRRGSMPPANPWRRRRRHCRDRPQGLGAGDQIPPTLARRDGDGTLQDDHRARLEGPHLPPPASRGRPGRALHQPLHRPRYARERQDHLKPREKGQTDARSFHATTPFPTLPPEMVQITASPAISSRRRARRPAPPPRPARPRA